MNSFQFALHYMPILAQGAVLTLEITVLGILFGLLLGVIAALERISHFWLFQYPARLYTWVIRGTPLLVQLSILYFGLPQIHVILPPMLAGVVGLAVNSGAYIAEIVRAGIQSIDEGQMEAAESLGMTYGKAMRRIIFPQAYRRLLPPLVNEFVALLKDSSLVSTIALTDLMRTGQQIYSATFRPMDTLVLVGIFYLVMTTIFVGIAGRLERRLEVRG